MHLALAVVAATAGFSTFTLVSAAWGLGSSWLAEIIKQDNWPKPINALLANAMLVVGAALATLTASDWSWNHFATAVLAAGAAALVNHQFVLKGFGVGDWLQTKTTFSGGVATNTTTVDINRLAAVLEGLLATLSHPTVINNSTPVVVPPDPGPAEEPPPTS